MDTNTSFPARNPWKLMIIDDDQQVHAVTHMVFRDFTYEDRGVEFLDGFSGEEAKQLIQENPDTAVLFLDVVMETDSAGLDLVRYIRNELGNKLIRIILRTGQPGEAPEARVTNDYDINDYRDKTNLDHQQMETLLLTSLRSYKQMRFIEQQLESEEVIGSLLRLSLAEMPLTEMLQQVINKLLAVNWHGLEAKGGIYLNTGKELVLAAHKGLPVFLLENCSRIPFGHCPCGLAAESGKPVVCSTVDQHHDVMCPGIQPLGHYCAPIRRGNDILGVLNLYTPEGYVLDEHENRFMEQLNNTLAGIVYRKQAEQSLAASEARYRSITQSATDAIISADSQGRLFSWNSGAEKMFGYSEQEVLGEDIVRLVPEQYLDQHTNSFRRRCQEDGKGLKQCAYEVAALKKDGQQIPVEIVLSHWSTSDNIYYTAIVRDITARKRVTRELDDLRNKLANIIDSMPSLLIGVDREGRINQWNLEARNSTGLTIEQVEGRPFPEIFPELKIDSAQISRAVRERREQKQQKLTWRKDNQDRYADITIYPLLTDSSEGAVIRIDDATDRVKLEELVIQSEKMLSLGGLAAGMAHEINNPLAGILQNIQVIQGRLREGLERNRIVADECGTSIKAIEAYTRQRGISSSIDAVMESGKRAAKVVQNMLSFSLPSQMSFSPHPLDELLDKVVALSANDYDLKRRFDFRDITILRDYDESLPPVKCKASEIQQVFLNLLKNSAQALHTVANPEEPACIELRLFKEDKMARIEVKDNGPGMPEEVRNRVFEPFYTTKEAGIGTGLGLSVSYFIITQNHGGTINVESSPDQGTSFVIRLPLDRDEIG